MYVWGKLCVSLSSTQPDLDDHDSQSAKPVPEVFNLGHGEILLRVCCWLAS